jgi:hypothetical protein
MKIVNTYITTQYCSTRMGGTCDKQVHKDSAELYAPALAPNDWYLIITWGILESGEEVELSKVIVKR